MCSFFFIDLQDNYDEEETGLLNISRSNNDGGDATTPVETAGAIDGVHEVNNNENSNRGQSMHLEDMESMIMSKHSELLMLGVLWESFRFSTLEFEMSSAGVYAWFDNMISY